MPSSEIQTRSPRLPGEITLLFGRIRRGIRQRAALSGALILVSGFCIYFWTTLLLDSGWFWLQTLELPRGLRVLLLALCCSWSCVVVFRRIVVPLVCRFSGIDLALLVERRFPRFEDRLVLAVEAAGKAKSDSRRGSEMLQRSVDEAGRMAAEVSPSEVFDVAPLHRQSRLSGGLLLSVLVPILISPSIPGQWWHAFVSCQENYRQRTTAVELFAVAEPGSRRIPFAGAGQLCYSHPTAADLELEFVIPDGGPTADTEWIVPDRIRVDVLRADGSRSRAWVAGSDSRSFRFVITQLREPVEIEVLAGDFRNTTPWRVDVVQSPGLDSIEVNCDYPEYTGWNLQRETQLSVTGSEISLPEGTVMQITAISAKPLQSARIVTDRFEIRGDQQSTHVTSSEGNVTILEHLPLLGDDGKSIRFSLQLMVSVLKQDSTSLFAADTPEVLMIPSNTSLRFFLHDLDNVMTVSPETLQITGVPDQAPVVVAQMTDIGNSVTRRAKIPIAGRIRDDYGVESGGLEFRVDDETNWRPRPFRRGIQKGSPDVTLQRSASEPYEVFDLEPLALTVGQAVTLTVVAADANPSPGPGMTRSSPMPFRIVSEDELLSLLYTREIALRSRFEEVIAQLEEILRDLEFHNPIAARADAAADQATQEDTLSLVSCSSRSSNNLRRQANEINALVLAFEEIMRQLINNAIPLHNAEAMQSGIIDPLRAASANELPAADRALGALLVAAETRQSLTPPLASSQQQVRNLIGSLRNILDNVRDLAEFHEALRDLRQLSEDQRKILEETRQLQKQQLFDNLLN